MDWLTAADALALLGTQPQTLYANVSRGRIKAKPDPADSRRSLYRGDDVRRLAQRGAGRRKQEAVAARRSMGRAVLRPAISTIDDGALLYRGQDACELAQTATLEDVAGCSGRRKAVSSCARRPGQGGLPRPSSRWRSRAARRHRVGALSAAAAQRGGAVLAVLAAALAGRPVRCRSICGLATAWGRPEAADAIRRALVLLADHELNASTFAARVTVRPALAVGRRAGGARDAAAARAWLASPERWPALADEPRPTGRGGVAGLAGARGVSCRALGIRSIPRATRGARHLLESFDLPPAFSAYSRRGER